MKSIFSIKKTAPYKGELSIRYNFKTLLKLLVLPLLFILWLLEGLWWLLKQTWPFFLWLGALFLVFWTWLKSLFKRKRKPVTIIEPTPKPEKERKGKDYWWLLLFLLLLPFLFWRGCGKEKEIVVIEEEVIDIYERSFNDVVIARAYLDGVQPEITSKSCPRALVGFKFINGKPVDSYNFEGLPYDQAVKVISRDWEPVVVGNLSNTIKLTDQQMATVTLVAMRMGGTGFARSTFLKKVNEGDFEGATKWLLLQDKDGKVQKTGDEPKQYFYVLRLLWNNEIIISDFLNLPMFSYKGISVKDMYDAKGNYVFDRHNRDALLEGPFPTPKDALGL